MTFEEHLAHRVPVHMKRGDWKKLVAEAKKMYRLHSRIMDAVDESVFLFLDEEEV